MKKLIIITLFFLTFSFSSFGAETYFIDFTKVLNSSKSGATAQKKLQQKLKNDAQKFKKLEETIRKEESEIISLKKTITAEEYKKKVETLRKKVADLQKDKQNSFKNISQSRNKMRQELLKAVNPILKKYMEDNKIRIIVDKKAVVLGDTSLEITDQIITILNKNLPSLKLN